MAAASGTAVKGIYGTSDLYTEQRKYDKDKSKFFIWRERGHAALVHVLITNMPKVSVTDPEPRHFEDGYRKFSFAATVSGAADGSTLIVADADATNIQAGDTLKIQGGGTVGGAASNWMNIANNTATFGARDATTYTLEEIIEVTSIGNSSGGNTTINVKRGIGADTVTSPPQILATWLVYHVGEASEDGAGTRVSFTQNPIVVNNYVQIFKVPYEITDIAQKTDIFGENEWQRKARNARRDFARRLERAFLSGHMYKRVGALNETIWYTGGLDEWIPNDTTHRVNAGRPLSQTYMNSVLKDVFLTGSEEKFGISGYNFVTKLSNACADKIRFNEKMSEHLGMDVNSFTAAGGGTVHFIPDFEMSQMGRDSECYFVDTKYLSYMYLEGMDIHIDKGKTGQGLQNNDETKTKHQIYGVIGLKRSFTDSHFLLYGIS